VLKFVKLGLRTLAAATTTKDPAFNPEWATAMPDTVEEVPLPRGVEEDMENRSDAQRWKIGSHTVLYGLF
jgi:hypothetical protein